MKKIRFATILLMLLCSFCLFAEGATEIATNETKSDFKEDNSLLANYLSDVNDYNNQYEKLCVELQMAYDKGDSQAYVDAKKALRALEYPTLSKDEAELIKNDIVKNNDVESANLLYQYSRYYRPTLTMISEENGFSYKSSISVNPGSEVTLPELRIAKKSMKFVGWGIEQGVVMYEPGEKIPMPLTDTTLYAVFEMNEDIVSGPNMIIELDSTTITRGSVVDFKFKLQNNGSDDLSNLEVKFESDDPYLIILTDKLSSRYFESCDSAEAVFKVITKAAIGTELNGTITVNDAKGNIWTKDVTLTVK